MGNPWQLTVNVAGVKPFEPGGVRLPEGGYTVKIVDTDLKAATDPTKRASLWFTVEVTEQGEYLGTKRNVIVGTDFTKDFHRKHFRALLMGVGANPQALDGGDLQLSSELFTGKQAYIYVETAAEGETRPDGKKAYDNVNFIAPSYYAKWKADQAAKAGASATGAQTPAASAGAPANGLGSLAGALGAPAPGATPGGALFGGK